MKAEGSPSNDTTLVFLTRLIQLACSVRSLLREHRFQFPHASTDMLTVVYPCLMGCLFDADDRVDPSVVQPGWFPFQPVVISFAFVLWAGMVSSI